jgi:hypothetical protein
MELVGAETLMQVLLVSNSVSLFSKLNNIAYFSEIIWNDALKWKHSVVSTFKKQLLFLSLGNGSDCLTLDIS